jgi:hypothetical protein
MQEIHAYFESMSNARNVQKILNASGHTKVHLDLAGSFDYEFSSEMNVAGIDSTPGLSTLVMKSGGRFFDMEMASLIAAGNSISGPGCNEDCRDISTRLSIKLEDKDAIEVENLIKENGGRIL